jgi:hypothetical protein
MRLCVSPLKVQARARTHTHTHVGAPICHNAFLMYYVGVLLGHTLGKPLQNRAQRILRVNARTFLHIHKPRSEPDCV